MVSWLEQQGMKSMHKETLRAIRAAVQHIEHHVSTELEKYMAPLNESINRLSQAITTELDQVREEAERNLAETKQALEEASADNAELNAALEAQVANSQGLVDSINSAKERLDSMSQGFESNDPQAPPDPNAPYPDNTLPGPGSAGGEHPDNTLPGPGSEGGAYPDNTLPNEIPVEGEPPVINPLKGRSKK